MPSVSHSPSSSTPTGEQRGGRPRDRSIDDAVLTATRQLLFERGYSDLTIGAVAERAGTNKPSIYRRWSTRQELVIDALSRELYPVAASDTGCTRCDLGELFVVFAESFARALPPMVLAPLVADCTKDERLHAHLLQTLLVPMQRQADDILERAVARGDVHADVPGDLVLDLVSSVIFYRVLFGHASVSRAVVAQASDMLLRGIAVDYEQLVKGSLAHAGEWHQNV